MGVAPSGEQWTIRHGDQEVVVTQVGATLRAYEVAGEPVLAGFGEDETCPHGRGQVLAPWPNRIGGGVYRWGGQEHRLAHTEPDRAGALHGLVAWLPWRLDRRDEASLTASVRLFPQPGWDWVLDLTCTYALGDAGLTVTTTATNVGDGTAPFGYGAHPYLTVGEARVDDVRLSVPADRFCEVDAERLLPVGPTAAESLRGVAGTDADLRGGRPLGVRGIDLAYTGLHADDDGVWRVRLDGPRAVTLWAQADRFGWLQVFTGDALPEPHRRTSGIAVEPLTCPPAAFATGEDVVALAPGEAWAGTWGLTPG